MVCKLMSCSQPVNSSLDGTISKSAKNDSKQRNKTPKTQGSIAHLPTTTSSDSPESQHVSARPLMENDKSDSKHNHRKGSFHRRARSVDIKPNSQTGKLKVKTKDTQESGKQKLKGEDGLVSDFKNLRISEKTKISAKLRTTRATDSGVCRTLEDIARYISTKQAKNIVIMAGAGISTSSGIPDFRTPGTGLYDNLQQYRIPTPQAIFDLDYFEVKPKPFFTLAKEIYPTGRYRPNCVHYFLRLLHEKNLLLRVYTQNIDGLERLAGLPPEKLIEAHGSFHTASCVKCRQSHPAEAVKKAIFSDKIPKCQKSGCLGFVKPNIVFFGEDLPRRFYYYLRDIPQADMLMVMGTSLEVEPFAGIVDSAKMTTPRVLFNRHAVGPFTTKRRIKDVVIKGDIAQKVNELALLLGWQQDLQDLIGHGEAGFQDKTVSPPESRDTTVAGGKSVETSSHHTGAIHDAKEETQKDSCFGVGAKHRSDPVRFEQRRTGFRKPPLPALRPNTVDSRQGVTTRRNADLSRHQHNTAATTLPKMNPPRHPPSFHSQKHLYRCTSNVETSSDDDSTNDLSSSDEN